MGPDDEVIREDVTDNNQATAQDEWRWPWTTGAINQTLKLQLQPQAQDLSCVVTHVTLDQPLEVTRQIRAGASFNLVISPEHKHVFKSNETVSFTCTTDGYWLAGCQFSWWDFDTGAGPLLDLSRGSESLPNPEHLNSRLSGYSYSGRALWVGECGITLQVAGYKTWMVACRVRPESGSWKYAWADLYADEWASMPHHNLMTPREAVVLPGEEARFIIDGQELLLQCRFTLPGMSARLYFNEGAESAQSTGRHRYLGAGPQNGECGLALNNVSEADSGPVKVYIRASPWKEHVRLMVIIAERRPTAPTLNVTFASSELTATCVVNNVRPGANITWFLGEDVIYRHDYDDNQVGPHDEWRWPWMTGAIKQILTLQLKSAEGKMLRCLVTHATLDKPLEARQLISRTGASYNLVISPEHKHVFKSNETVSFTCTTGIRIAGCQFSWWDFDTGAGPLLDFSRGSNSKPNSDHLNSRLSWYMYSGRGLRTGECGITLQVAGYKTWMVACRVRPESGSWKYAWADLYADEWAPMPHHNLMTPREAVVLPGGETRFVIDGQELLLQCRFTLPGMSARLSFDEGAGSAQSTGRHRYLGAGPQNGECGLALTNVSEADSGPVKVYIRAPSWKEHVQLMAIVVERRPTAPTMKVTYALSEITATCELKNVRPGANITWFLGEDVIYRDRDDYDDNQVGPHDEWRWPWMTGIIKQTLTLQLKSAGGKMLRCLVTHATLNKPLEARQLISWTG